MSDLMNYNSLFVVKDLVNDAVVADTELVQSRKIASI
jgi:hypothetical protein